MAQVLNTLAHEIRTPLAVSQGYLKLYVDGRLATPDDQRRALQQTRRSKLTKNNSTVKKMACERIILRKNLCIKR